MVEIKLITPDMDFNVFKPYDWDVELYGKPYYVIRIPGYVHTIGGHYGNNDLWAYPRNERPSYKNIVEFNADGPVRWGILYEPASYLKSKYGEDEIRDNGLITITRNSKPFCRFNGDIYYGIDRARTLISEINEHPLEFNTIDFDKKMIGRKVWWRSQPAIIVGWGDGCVILQPDGISCFETPKEFLKDEFYDPDYSHTIRAEFFDKHIWWFRD